ncbi:MAG: FkbM family methyltransferase [Candidatus Sumerlaeaceae bacterium]
MGLWRAFRQISGLFTVPADGLARRVLWQLACIRYRYPGLRLLSVFLGKPGPARDVVVGLRVKGRLLRLQFDPSDSGDVASVFENFIELPLPEKYMQNIHRAVCLGGHIGTFALALLARNPDCRVVIFEPNARNRDFLLRNLQLNGFRAEVRPEAVWIKAGKVRFLTRESNAGKILTAESDSDENAITVEAVDVRQLDDKLLSQVQFVEMDIEGAEWEILPLLLPKLSPGCIVYFEAHHVDQHWHELVTLRNTHPCQSWSLGRIGSHELRVIRILK